MLQVRVSTDMMEALEDAADQHGVSAATVVRRAVLEFLNGNEDLAAVIAAQHEELQRHRGASS